jgi:DNA-binding transcriptional regulator LsrR (DeoR family)
VTVNGAAGPRTSAPPASGDRRDLLVEVAWLHHEHGLTQDEIARRFHVSRSTISRALADAERQGIVQVVVTVPMRRESRLAADLAARLGVPVGVGIRMDDEQPAVAAARAAARLLERVADAGNATIAVSWGRTLAAMARLVRPRVTASVRVVDAVGHAGGERMIPAVDVTRALAAALGAAVVHLPSPAFVARGSSYDAIVGSEAVARALATARDADVTLVSIGVVGGASQILVEGLADDAAMAVLVREGAVGEVLGRWYDAAGRAVDAPGLWAVGLSLADLHASRRVVAVAGGADKAGALRAALAGGIVQEIVVDDGLAEALLAADVEVDADVGAEAAPPVPTYGRSLGSTGGAR